MAVVRVDYREMGTTEGGYYREMGTTEGGTTEREIGEAPKGHSTGGFRRG